MERIRKPLLGRQDLTFQRSTAIRESEREYLRGWATKIIHEKERHEERGELKNLITTPQEIRKSSTDKIEIQKKKNVIRGKK